MTFVRRGGSLDLDLLTKARTRTARTPLAGMRPGYSVTDRLRPQDQRAGPGNNDFRGRVYRMYRMGSPPGQAKVPKTPADRFNPDLRLPGWWPLGSFVALVPE